MEQNNAEAGCGNVDTACTNDAPGAPCRRRTGVRRAQTQSEFAETLRRARAVDPGLAHLLCLIRLLGLRPVEALRCVRELADWLVLLRIGVQYLRLPRGVGTSRPRRIEIIDPLREDTIRAIEAALEHCETHDGKLIAGADHKTQRNRLRALLQSARISGELSSQSLRHAYAVSLSNALMDAGASPEQARERVFASVGQGLRAHMFLDTYLREIGERSHEVPRAPGAAGTGSVREEPFDWGVILFTR
ncbi:integrase domain-containing protein [Paraburkholderia diazotrophica]|uniref:integrase domain-containing protein n=1 Tax=Paraburkholderia diazotrophica TaxID=667676 RepID=UPI003180E5A0